MLISTRARLVAAAVVGMLVVPALVAVSAPASAVVPGVNGKIAYVSGTGWASEIWTMNPDGTGKNALTANATRVDDYPSWSPDGTKIAYVSGTGSGAEIWVMNGVGSQQTQLTTNASSDRHPAWSPDGAKIAYTNRTDNGEDDEIWVMNADGTGQIALTANNTFESSPAWSPDGTKLAYMTVGYLGGDADIWVMNADGTGQAPLTNTNTHESDPAWSPDGALIAYGKANTESEVWRMNSDGTGQTALLASPGPDIGAWEPAWSPDGDSILFRARPSNVDDEYPEVWVANADGTGRSQLTLSGVASYRPDWGVRPDGPPIAIITLPAITGTPRVGATLTASNGTWSTAPTSFVYAWKAGGSAVGTNQNTYVPVAGDVSKTITVTVTAKKAGFTDGSATSAATAAVTAGDFTTAPTPTITGTAQVGQTLTAAEGTWVPAQDSFTYVWRKDGGSMISGATGGTYQLTGAEEAKTITVTVTAKKAGFNDTARTSAATATVTAAASSTITNTTTPAITGTARVGSTLTASNGTWSTTPTSFDYAWRAGSTPVGANQDTYVPVADDLGKPVRVTVTAKKSGFTDGTAMSSPTDAVAAAASDFSTAPTPAITGTSQVGQTLTAAEGTWVPVQDSFTYVWKANGTAISGATAKTYALTAAEQAKTVTVTVTAKKAGFNDTTKTSAATGAVLAAPATPITNTTLPAVTGTAKVGSTLTASDGTWSTTPTSFVYAWRAGGTVVGTNQNTYIPAAGDINKTVTVTVTAKKAGFTDGTATSASTAAVQAAGGGSDTTAPTVALTAPAALFRATNVTTVRWAGSDNAGGSGIARYQLRYQRAPFNDVFGAWIAPAGWQALTGTSTTQTVGPGYTHCYSVRAVDEAGNVGAWSAARCAAAPLDDRSFAGSAGWSRLTGSAFYRSTYSQSGQLNRTLSKAGVRARHVALLVTKCPTCGTVQVKIGTTTLGTVSLKSTKVLNKQLVVFNAGAVRSGTVVVTTKSTGKLVRIDGVGVSRK